MHTQNTRLRFCSLLDLCAVTMQQCDNRSGGFGGLVRGFDDAREEEFNPCLPITRFTDGLQVIIIGLPVCFEIPESKE